MSILLKNKKAPIFKLNSYFFRVAAKEKLNYSCTTAKRRFDISNFSDQLQQFSNNSVFYNSEFHSVGTSYALKNLTSNPLFYQKVNRAANLNSVHPCSPKILELEKPKNPEKNSNFFKNNNFNPLLSQRSCNYLRFHSSDHVCFVQKNLFSTKIPDPSPPKVDSEENEKRKGGDTRKEETLHTDLSSDKNEESNLKTNTLEPPFLNIEKNKESDAEKTNHVKVEVQFSDPSFGLLGLLRDTIISTKVFILSMLTRSHLEKSFQVESFLESAKAAYITVNEYFWKGDFESLEKCVSPRILGTLQKAHADLQAKEMKVEYKMKDAHPKLIDFQLSLEKNENEGYGLKPLASELENYHDDLFLVLVVKFKVEMKIKLVDKEGKVQQDNSVSTAQTVNFARQIPKVKFYFDPVDEIVSPWYIVALH